VAEKLFEVRFSEDETSSTNFYIFVSGEFTLKSLIIMRNNVGTSLVPWGTPAVTGSQLEKDSPILTRCLRSQRKFIIQGITDRLTPRSSSFSMRILYNAVEDLGEI
jgi:hypothetical protein